MLPTPSPAFGPFHARRIGESFARGWLSRAWSFFRPVSIEEFVGDLAPFVAEQQFRQMVEAAHRHPRLRRHARQALRAPAANRAALHAAELIAAGWIGVGVFSDAIVCDWMMPLLERSTERYLPRMILARYLIARIHMVSDPRTVVSMIETHVMPLSRTDYSNFRVAFSMHTWSTLRRYLTKPRLVSELDLFVTAADRAAFWKAFSEADPS